MSMAINNCKYQKKIAKAKSNKKNKTYNLTKNK